MHAADCQRRHPRRQRDRRRGRGDRHRRGLGAPAGRQRPGRGQLLRRRRGQPGRAAGGVQPGRAVAGAGACSSARTTATPRPCRSHGAVAGTHHRPGRGVRHPGRPPWTGRTRRRCCGRRRAAVDAGPGRRRARRFIECLDLPLRRPPHLGAHGPAALPHRRGGRRRPVPGPGATSRAPGSPPTTGRRSTPRSRRCSTRRSRSPLASPEPDPAGALDYLYASRPARPGGGVLMPILSYLQGAEPGARRRDGRATRRCSCSARTSGSARQQRHHRAAQAVRPGPGAWTRRCRSRPSPASPPAPRWPGRGR